MKKMILAVLGVVAVAGSAMAAGPEVTKEANVKAYQCLQGAEVPRPMWQRILSFGILSNTVTVQEKASIAPDTFTGYKAEAMDDKECQAAITGMTGVGAKSVTLACQTAAGQIETVSIDGNTGGCGYTWRKGNL